MKIVNKPRYFVFSRTRSVDSNGNPRSIKNIETRAAARTFVKMSGKNDLAIFDRNKNCIVR